MHSDVTTVLFDFDGTLVFHEPDTFDVISAFCSEIGQPLSPEAERLGRRTQHQYFADPVIHRQLETFSRDGFWQHLNQHLLNTMSIRGDLGELAMELAGRFKDLEFVHHCPEAGCNTLAELRARGYGLGLITNRDNVEHFYGLLDRVALRPYFDMTLASGEVGIKKPEPGIFHAALEQMAVTSEESIYVGDNYWADFVGAQRAGLTPVLLDPEELFPECACQSLARIDRLLDGLPGRPVHPAGP